MRTILALAVVLSALALAPVARAQSDDIARGAAARALFQEGVDLARRGDYAAATDRFRRAHALRPAAPIAFNLASALAHEGGLVEASEIVQRMLRDTSITPQLRASAERLRDEVTPRLARLTVRLEGDPQDVRVEIDQRAIAEAMLGVPLPIDPGSHEIRALRDGETIARDRVEVGEGGRGELTLAIPARPAREVTSAAVSAPGVAVASPSASVAPGALETPRESEPADQGGGGVDDVALALGITAGVLVVGAVTVTAVMLTAPQTPSPVDGNAMPGVLTW